MLSQVAAAYKITHYYFAAQLYNRKLYKQKARVTLR